MKVLVQRSGAASVVVEEEVVGLQMKVQIENQGPVTFMLQF